MSSRGGWRRQTGVVPAAILGETDDRGALAVADLSDAADSCSSLLTLPEQPTVEVDATCVVGDGDGIVGGSSPSSTVLSESVVMTDEIAAVP